MLDISIMLLVYTAVIFLLLIGVLNNMLYKPLIAYMQKRNLDIKNDLHRVGSNESEINALNLEAEKIILDAKIEAASIKDKAVQKAKLLAQGKLNVRRAKLAEEYVKFEKNLSKEHDKLSNELASNNLLFKKDIIAKYNTL